VSGDCGHGWGYHEQGASGPCSKCEDEYEKACKLEALERDAERYRYLRANYSYNGLQERLQWYLPHANGRGGTAGQRLDKHLDGLIDEAIKRKKPLVTSTTTNNE
jgi:hypothetical protein